jgi:DNA-3-methyladenine glycosylase II
MRKAIQHLKDSDPALAVIIAAAGPYRISYLEPGFDTLARSIVYQQLSGKAASTIFGRLLAAAGRGGKLSTAAVLRLGVEGLRPLGLSNQKAAYIFDLAAKTRSRQVNFAKIQNLADDEVIEHLTQVKGVGVWTAHMYLIFALQRHDVLPTGDLGIRMAMKKHYNLAELPAPPEMERMAARWQPYRSVACWYLWRSLDGAGGI